MAAIVASSISTPGAITLELPGSSRWDTTTARRDFRANSSCGSPPYGAKARRVRCEDLQVKIRRMGPPRMAEICLDCQSEGFHSPEAAQHPAFYRYRESYPRRNGSPRNCCSRAGDEQNAVPVSV